uniref:Putative secreted peptide n=1 Tax=Anopheles braziliensis TaxID=58242 RepID=A0A2M3ZVU6_9DIPT
MARARIAFAGQCSAGQVLIFVIATHLYPLHRAYAARGHFTIEWNSECRGYGVSHFALTHLCCRRCRWMRRLHSWLVMKLF